MRTDLISFLIALPILAGCDLLSGDSDEVTFDEMFPEVWRITLEEVASEPMAAISNLLPRPDGGFVVVDARTHRIREYDANGRLERVLGGPGRQVGELQEPTAVMRGEGGELHVVERGSSRRTVFWPADSASTFELPGLYGFWLHRIDDGFIAGVGAEEARFAILSPDGQLRARFGSRDRRVVQTPYWIYYVQERATAFGDRIFINSSFSPVVRVFSTVGDSLYSIVARPSDWVEPAHPGVNSTATAGDRIRLDRWARSFTVVAGLAATNGVLVVQFGGHDPGPTDPYRVIPRTASVFEIDGSRLAADIELKMPILAGGEFLYLLAARPPEPWTISVRIWARPDLEADG